MGLKKWVAAASAALALFALPGVCSAEIVITIPGQYPSAHDFLTQLVLELPESQMVQPHYESGEGGGIFIQSGPALSNPLVKLSRGPTDAAMWNLVALFNSQKTARHFDTVPTGLTTFAAPLVLTPSSVSAVPLPSATWMFVLGFLGLAGSRLTTPRDESARLPLAVGHGGGVSPAARVSSAIASTLAFLFGSRSAPFGAFLGRSSGAK